MRGRVLGQTPSLYFVNGLRSEEALPTAEKSAFDQPRSLLQVADRAKGDNMKEDDAINETGCIFCCTAPPVGARSAQ